MNPLNPLNSLNPLNLPTESLGEAETLRKRLLFDLVLETFRSVAAGAPQHGLWVPGRLEIFGKHTDYGGGHTLVAPVPRGFIVVARARHDAVVAVHDASRREQFILEANDAARGKHTDPPTSGPAEGLRPPERARRETGLTAGARSAKPVLTAGARSAKAVGAGMR